MTDLLKFLYELKKEAESKDPMTQEDQDKALETAKQMLINSKGKDNDIFELVDDHVADIVSLLDAHRRWDYIEFRERIAHDRVDHYNEKERLQKEQDQVLATVKTFINLSKGEEDCTFYKIEQIACSKVAELDESRKADYIKFRREIMKERQKIKREQEETESERSNTEARKTYTRPTSKTYHLIKDCGGEASDYGKAYETKVPRKVCKEISEDTINSSIQPKGIGFIPGKEEYHDDECLIWVSHKVKVLKQICATCERERIYAEDIDRQLKERLTKSNKSTGSGSQQG